MKCRDQSGDDDRAPSRPARGAWVEMSVDDTLVLITPSRPARGAWVEIGVVHETDG